VITKFTDFVENELQPDTLIITCGLPATGKTTAADFIAKSKGYKLLRTDLIRLNVLKGEDVFDQEVASDMGKRKHVYDEMFSRADEIASREKSILLDGTFITQALRRKAAVIADKRHKTFAVLETRCPQEVALRRIFERSRKSDYESNAVTEEAYFNNKEKFEPVDLEDIRGALPALQTMYVLVDTTSDNIFDWVVTKEQALP